jgi:hypothetical protein
MHYLYHGGGAAITEVLGPVASQEEWDRIRAGAIRLLTARRHKLAASLLEQMPFEWRDATNFFSDEFTILKVEVPVEKYVALQEAELNKTIEHPFKAIADAITEISPDRPLVRFVVAQLDTEIGGAEDVAPPSPRVTSEAIESALADAELLARARGPEHAIDRVHTALHGYLRVALERVGVDASATAAATELFKLLRENDPGLRAAVVGGDESKRIVMSLASVVDATNTLRNTMSGAHPSSSRLSRAEAQLMINATRSLIHYLDEKLAGDG